MSAYLREEYGQLLDQIDALRHSTVDAERKLLDSEFDSKRLKRRISEARDYHEALLRHSFRGSSLWQEDVRESDLRIAGELDKMKAADNRMLDAGALLKRLESEVRRLTATSRESLAKCVRVEKEEVEQRARERRHRDESRYRQEQEAEGRAKERRYRDEERCREDERSRSRRGRSGPREEFPPRAESPSRMRRTKTAYAGYSSGERPWEREESSSPVRKAFEDGFTEYHMPPGAGPGPAYSPPRRQQSRRGYPPRTPGRSKTSWGGSTSPPRRKGSYAARSPSPPRRSKSHRSRSRAPSPDRERDRFKSRGPPSPECGYRSEHFQDRSRSESGSRYRTWEYAPPPGGDHSHGPDMGTPGSGHPNPYGEGCWRRCEAWQAEYKQSLLSYATLRRFPEPPSVPCGKAACEIGQGSRALQACECNISAAFISAGDGAVDWKTERKRWHPDKFSSCPGAKREQFKLMAQEIFVVVSRELEQGR